MSETNSLNFLDQTTPPPRSTEDAAKPTDAVGNALFERLGIGGMGEVYRFGDDALRRDLAIKVLKAELKGDADADERFLREARLAGSLQHPGVVPIHQLSRLADGRPCYTMKLVRGRTLADLLRDEPEGLERLPRLLAILEKVCQAVAYAHSKHVIHRDLKPSNVMVGEFGEVQVMDWGLAKELSHSEPTAPAEPTQTAETAAWTADGAGLSRAGSALGTPAYMPPEQAAGDWDIVDERADVFALGAILCEMLTGRPPYQGANRDDILRRARRGDLAEALGRLEKCGADTVLVNLCRECLAAERLQRPRHADIVAERLASYQAEVRERLRQAELQRARAEVKALEERKRRRLIAVLALFALALFGSGGTVWWQWQRRQAETDGAVAVALGEARSSLQQARSDVLTAAGYDKAIAAAHNASEMARAGGASQEMQRQAQDLFEEVKQESEAAAKDRRLLTALLEVHGLREGPKYRRDDKGMMMAMAEPTVEEQFASAFRNWGLDVDMVPTAEAAARLKARPTAVVTEVIAALDEWTNQRRVDNKLEAEKRVADLASALDDDPSSLRRELRKIMARGSLPMERALGVVSAALRPVPVTMEMPLGEDHRRLRQLVEKIDATSEPVLGLLTLVRALGMAGEETRAEQLLRAAIVVRPREVVLLHTLGQLLVSQQPPRRAAAVEFYRAARCLRPDLGVSLAKALIHDGRADEGLALLSRMVHESSDNPTLHFEQGYALMDLGKLAEAETAYRKAISLTPNDAIIHSNLGALLLRLRRHVEAEEALRKAIALKSDDLFFVSVMYVEIGSLLTVQGRYVEAAAAWRNVAVMPEIPLAYLNLGAALNDGQGKHVEAEAAFRKAIALKPDYADAYVNLGVALLYQKKHVQAEAAFRKAIHLDPEDASSWFMLGHVLSDREKYAEAEAATRQAIALDPKHAKAHYNLGIALAAKGQWDEAVAEYCQTIRLKPDYAEAHCNLGQVLQQQGRFDEALASYRQGHELGSKQPDWRYPSLKWVRKAQRFVELDKKIPKILKGEAAPDNADDAITMAEICKLKKRYAVSARLYADAFTVEPKFAAENRYNAACYAALAAAGQGEDARSLSEKERSRLGRQALGWLRDDLTAYAKLAEQNNSDKNKTIQQTLAHWQSDTDLASIRDPQALERLPENERADWQALWRDVDKLAKRVAEANDTKP